MEHINGLGRMVLVCDLQKQPVVVDCQGEIDMLESQL